MRLQRLCLLVFPLAAAVTASAELQTAEEIDACYQENQPDDSAVSTISMNVKDRIGAVTVSRAKLYWKNFEGGHSKVMMRFFDPAELRGAGLLMIEKKDRNDLFMYLPELRRVKRISSRMTSGSMFGTDFSYEDFERIQGMAEESDKKRLEDAELQGAPVYVIQARPSDGDSGYERIVTYIDKETCVALRSELYEKGDSPRKVLTVDRSKLAKEGDVFLGREQLMKDFRDETETLLVIEEVEVGAGIPRKMFSQRELEAGGH